MTDLAMLKLVKKLPGLKYCLEISFLKFYRLSIFLATQNDSLYNKLLVYTHDKLYIYVYTIIMAPVMSYCNHSVEIEFFIMNKVVYIAAADPGGGARGPCPPVPVKTSHKKDGRHRRPIIFHVSCSPPPDHPGSDAL